MPLTGIYGKGGSGKNTIATYLKLKYMRNIETYTNFPLKTPNTEMIDSMLLFELPDTDNPRMVIWDEAYIEGLDNRDSMSLENRIQSYLLFQARKNNMSIVSISQLQILDIRYRSLEETIISCKDRPIYDKNLNPYKGVFKYLFYKVGRKVIPYTLRYFTAKKLFPFFDTKRKMLPKNFEVLKSRIELQNPKKRNLEVNKIVNKILKNYDIERKDVTHLWVKNIMLDMELPNLSLEPYVYIRLKNKL